MCTYLIHIHVLTCVNVPIIMGHMTTQTQRLLWCLTLSAPRGTDGSFQPVPSMTIVLFIVNALPHQVGL